MPTLPGDLRPCDECGAQTDKASLVYAYIINAHDMELPWNREAQFCPACAEIEARRRTCGDPEDVLLACIADGTNRMFGEPMSVRWIQGDEHKILVHVRRI
jgi:hypothetical protein